MRIGPILIAHPLTLAPLEEHSNYPFRLLMKEFGASLVVSERVDAADVARRERRTLRQLYTTPAESPRAGQISGADPDVLAAAAAVVEELGFDMVDLNFDCPVRRLLARGEGGALLADPPTIARLVAAVVRVVSIPVTLKIRSGPGRRASDRRRGGPLQRSGRRRGRQPARAKRRPGLRRRAGLGLGRGLKQAVKIPVIGSGGIRTAADAMNFCGKAGPTRWPSAAAAWAIRGFFRQARAMLGDASVRGPTAVERGRVLLQLIRGEFRFYGPPLALRRLPRTSGYFARYLPDDGVFRQAVRQVKDLPQFRRLVKEHFR